MNEQCPLHQWIMQHKPVHSNFVTVFTHDAPAPPSFKKKLLTAGNVSHPSFMYQFVLVFCKAGQVNKSAKPLNVGGAV